MGVNLLFQLLIALMASVSEAFSKEVSGDMAESQNKYNSIEDSKMEDGRTRSLLSLSNIQNDLWNEQFVNGFSCIELEDSRSGRIHSLSNSSNIKLGSNEFVVTSSNMPSYDSLIVFYESVHFELNSNDGNSETSEKNWLIVLNETENEILIKSNRLSSGSICMGLLNGTEIWSREFCEIVQDSGSDEVACSCKGSFIYSLFEPRDEKRALQMQYNKFNFPDLTNGGGASAHHANDAYLNRVARSDDPNSNHGDKVPFPPLHGNVGGRSNNVNVQRKDAQNQKQNSETALSQDELLQYYHSGPAVKYVISSPDNGHIFDKSRLNELNNKSIASKEAIRAGVGANEVQHVRKGPWETSTQPAFSRERNSTSSSKVRPDSSGHRVDSITINMKLKNIDYGSFGNPTYKQNFTSKFINTFSVAMNIIPTKIRVINIWNEEGPILRGGASRSVGIAVKIMTLVPDEAISKLKGLKSRVCEFSKMFEFQIISISKNIGPKSISNEIVTEDNKEEVSVSNEELPRTLPIIFTMELRTKKPHINQKEAFTLLEDELSRSMKIPKSSIDIPEFTYKQLNDPYTNEAFLSIHTEIWVHPDKQEREEYRKLLTKIYSNIIHSKKSEFSKQFLCNKYEVKGVPHIRAQNNHAEKIHNTERSLPEPPAEDVAVKGETQSIGEGRISKIGSFYQINQNNHNSTLDAGSQEYPPDTDSQNGGEHMGIKPVVYLIE
ncbi:putative signal peptide-containing protein [Cryptosporidium canis]|nr:putative signal peptide-containing protein [Cryptosporidium canis]